MLRCFPYINQVVKCSPSLTTSFYCQVGKPSTLEKPHVLMRFAKTLFWLHVMLAKHVYAQALWTVLCTFSYFRLFINILLSLQFFAQSGFPCPPRRNPSDHFLRCVNSDFDRVKQSLKSSYRQMVIFNSFGYSTLM